MESSTAEFLLQRWLPALLLTLAVEVPLFVLLTRGMVRPGRAALVGVACSLVTHPLLWFVWPRLIRDYTAYAVSGELLVALIETGLFYLLARPVPLLRAMAAAFVANAGSYGAGVLFRAVGIF